VLSSEPEELLAENALPAECFPKENRLLKSVEFDRVFKNGTKVITPVLVFFWNPSPAGINRLGLVVSRKVGNAVRRNRIKRMTREAFRLNQASLFSGVDIVTIPRYGALEKTLEDYRRSFQILEKKINRQKKVQYTCQGNNS